MRLHVVLLLVTAIPALAFGAALEFPKNLSLSDRKTVVEILGYGAQIKMLSSPVPLGGEQGFEMGLSTEYIPIADIGTLGSRSSAQGEFNYKSLGFGKGLPYNVDTFLQFTPLPQADGAFGYGGHVRWGFWEFLRFPAITSLVAHASGMNYVNLLGVRTTGVDLVMTVAMEEASLYFGGGPIRTIGSFVGGSTGITAEKETMEVDASGLHTVFGITFNFEKLFLALEMDRVVQSTYAGRVGYRF